MMVSAIAKALQLILLVREPVATRAGPLKSSDTVASDAGLYSVRTTEHEDDSCQDSWTKRPSTHHDCHQASFRDTTTEIARGW